MMREEGHIGSGNRGSCLVTAPQALVTAMSGSPVATKIKLSSTRYGALPRGVVGVGPCPQPQKQALLGYGGQFFTLQGFTATKFAICISQSSYLSNSGPVSTPAILHLRAISAFHLSNFIRI
jgi:hypothetical protein